MLVLALLAGLCFGAASARAEGFGELRRFGEPAPEGVEPGKGKISTVEFSNHLIGVDSAENSVFVLEEPQEQGEEIETGAHKGEHERFFRVQKFNSSSGTFVAQSKVFNVITPEDNEEEDEENVQGLAVDPGAGVLYFLINAKKVETLKNKSTEAADYLYALSTSTLEPASGTKKGVLAGPKELGAESKEEGSEPKSLLEPKGITVDPTTHEVVILAKIDFSGPECSVSGSECHWGLQRIRPEGQPGELYVDRTNFLQPTSAEPPFPEPPSSPASTSAGQILVEEEGHYTQGIAAIPTHFKEATENSTPPTWLINEPEPQSNKLKIDEARTASAFSENPYGGGLSVSPEGTLLQMAEVENVEANLSEQGVFVRSSATGAVEGWTGGQAQRVHKSYKCALQPGEGTGENPQVAAGKEEKLFVLAPEFLEKIGGEELTHDAVIEFGPGGTGCPTDAAEEIKARQEGSEVKEPSAGNAVLLASHLKLTDSLKATWVIENVATKAKVFETANSEGRFDEAVLEHTFNEAGEFKVSVKIQTDNLAGPQQLETSRTFKVKSVGQKPVVTKQPKSVTVAAGSNAVFEAEASGTPKPEVIWYVKKPGAATFEEDKTDPSAITPKLTVKATLEDSGNEYRAVFNNGVGGPVESEPAKLTVTAACSASPAIETQTAAQTVTAPAEASFTVKEGAIPANCSAASIKWEVSSNGGTSFAPVSGSNVSGATSANLRINPTNTGESGRQFRAVLTNTHASTDSSAATLTVNESLKTPETKPETKPEETPKVEVEHEIFTKPVSPKATIAGASFTVGPAGAVTLKVSCPAGAGVCAGTVVLRTLSAVSASVGAGHQAKSKKAILTLGTASFSLAGGQGRAVTLHLSAKAHTLLVRSHVLRARATVSSHGSTGETATSVTVITLRPAKRKH